MIISKFISRFTFLARTIITLALLLDAVIMFRVFEIDATKQKVTSRREHIQSDWMVFIEPSYNPTLNRLKTEKDMLADEREAQAGMSERALIRSQANISIMRNTIRALEDSVSAMEYRARLKADSQPRESAVISFWQEVAIYCGIILGAFIPPMFVIAFLWQWIPVPVKMRGIARFHADWTFIVSIVVKAVYITTFIFQWDRLMELLGSERACYFAGVYAPGLSIICSLYLFSLERRIFEQDKPQNEEPKSLPEKPVEPAKPVTKNVQELERMVSESGANGRINLYTTPKRDPRGTQAYHQPAETEVELLEDEDIETIQPPEYDRAPRQEKYIPAEIPQSKLPFVMRGRKVLAPMWTDRKQAINHWKNPLLTTGIQESIAEDRKVDLWHDVPPPIDKEHLKLFMRCLILNKQNKRGDRPFLIQYLAEDGATVETLRRTIQNAQAVMMGMTSRQRKELRNAAILEYVRKGVQMAVHGNDSKTEQMPD